MNPHRPLLSNRKRLLLVRFPLLPSSPTNRTSPLIKFISPVLAFLLHLGYFGPVLMGILDSSFLFLPFGNDLLVVTLVARHHQGWLWYVLAAALGSTVGIFVLALVAQKLGEEGIKKMAGEKRFARLHRMIDTHGSKAVSLACHCPAAVPFHHGDCGGGRPELIAAPNLCRKLFHSWNTFRRSWLARDQVWETHLRSGQL